MAFSGKGETTMLLILLMLLAGRNAQGQNGTINICVKKPAVAVAATSIQCYDKDLTSDDIMTSTEDPGEEGCTSYVLEYPIDGTSGNGWDFTGGPDIYCKVTSPGYKTLITDVISDNKAPFIYSKVTSPGYMSLITVVISDNKEADVNFGTVVMEPE